MTKQQEQLLANVQKPGRYVGGETHVILKNKDELQARIAFCFPEPYEIGMSYLGLQILYDVMNQRPDVWCERAFAPWVDMEEQLRATHTPLWALESCDPLSDFDILAFTLQYELSYTNVLNMLELGGVEVLREKRSGLKNLVIAGGPCAYNPEPMSDFIDLFIIGEGEEVNPKVIDLYIACKTQGLDKNEFLRRAAQIQGVYVPSLYDVCYHDDGTVASITPQNDAPPIITKAIVADLDTMVYPTQQLVPSVEVIHDRAMIELFRGCARGCRFCAAGHTNRPVRFKSPQTLIQQGIDTLRHTGSEEISMVSLSTSDYPALDELCDGLLAHCQPRHISLSLPSLRADSFSLSLMQKVQATRKSGLTFAPEAGTPRLREVINKNLTEDDLLKACGTAFSGGWTNVKLYYMMGLPTETDADIEAIHGMAWRVFDTWRQNTPNKARAAKISVSVSCFVPKPHTPFQWEAQETVEAFERKQGLLRSGMKKMISYHWHDAPVSFLEGVLARGDRRQGKVLYSAWKRGCRLDSWNEFFNLDHWRAAFAENGLDMAFYANRVRPRTEVLPWSHISTGISAEHLWQECQQAYNGEQSVDCLQGCMACGADALCDGGLCHG